MKRRNLIKNLAFGAVAAVAMPTWAKNWTASELPITSILSANEDALLVDIIDTLIPKTDTPGAIEVDVDKFVKAMADSMFSDTGRKAFYGQIPEVDAFAKRKYGSSFANLSPNQKTECLGLIEQNESEKLSGFFKTLKNYAIQGYTSSEWYMTEKAGYEYAPGYGYGCVDVK